MYLSNHRINKAIMDLESRIKESEKDFIKKRGSAAKFIGLSVYGYAELMREMAVRLGSSDDVWSKDFTNYEGLQVLVSQDQGFPEFILMA